MKTVEIYTDGACSGNPGKGGWGVILMFGGKTKELSGGELSTTNNRMEVYAAISGLSALTETCRVNLYSDSAYLVNAIEQHWLDNWKTKNWKTSAKDPVKNRDLWEKLSELLERHCVTFIKVKGHSDNEFNNRCDRLAREAIKNLDREQFGSSAQ